MRVSARRASRLSSRSASVPVAMRSSVTTMPVPALRSWNVGLAAAAAVALITEAVLRARGDLAPGAYVLALAAATPLAWRMLTPVAALVGVEAGALACAFALDSSYTATAMIVVELFTVALLGHRQRSLIVGVVTAVGVMLAIFSIDGTLDVGAVALRLPLVFASLALGDTVRSRQQLRKAAQERAEHAAREREEEARRRVLDERLRIARELHDTLAHSLVAINVRAAVTLDLHDPLEPTAALVDIKQASVTALRDLRATLGLLRQQGDTAPTAPASGLEDLPRLLEHARSMGLNADVDVQVNGAVIPSAIGAAAFRIVQEALTNVVRHADASSAQVRLSSSGAILEIDVIDDGRVDSAAASPGFGLRGMAERASALGGRVATGPQPHGGWQVHATLPLKERPPR